MLPSPNPATAWLCTRYDNTNNHGTLELMIYGRVILLSNRRPSDDMGWMCNGHRIFRSGVTSSAKWVKNSVSSASLFLCLHAYFNIRTFGHKSVERWLRVYFTTLQLVGQSFKSLGVVYSGWVAHRWRSRSLHQNLLVMKILALEAVVQAGAPTR